MPKFNLNPQSSIEISYQQGLLPQRNNRNLFYQDSSSRSNLNDFVLSSENRRILRKTENFNFEIRSIYFDLDMQKQIFGWLKILKWDFPINSVKTVFTKHLFNNLYVWKLNNNVVAYSVCYFGKNISHIGYVFYNPQYSGNDLPIRLVLQFIIDSHDRKLNYAYLGRFSESNGFYKRNMPGFEYFKNDQWVKY